MIVLVEIIVKKARVYISTVYLIYLLIQQVMKIFEFSDGSLLFVFLTLYMIASIMFCFAVR